MCLSQINWLYSPDNYFIACRESDVTVGRLCFVKKEILRFKCKEFFLYIYRLRVFIRKKCSVLNHKTAAFSFEFLKWKRKFCCLCRNDIIAGKLLSVLSYQCDLVFVPTCNYRGVFNISLWAVFISLNHSSLKFVMESEVHVALWRSIFYVWNNLQIKHSSGIFILFVFFVSAWIEISLKISCQEKLSYNVIRQNKTHIGVIFYN